MRRLDCVRRVQDGRYNPLIYLDLFYCLYYTIKYLLITVTSQRSVLTHRLPSSLSAISVVFSHRLLVLVCSGWISLVSVIKKKTTVAS